LEVQPAFSVIVAEFIDFTMNQAALEHEAQL
jgi:hypothetical protein